MANTRHEPVHRPISPASRSEPLKKATFNLRRALNGLPPLPVSNPRRSLQPSATGTTTDAPSPAGGLPLHAGVAGQGLPAQPAAVASDPAAPHHAVLLGADADAPDAGQR